MRTSTTNLLQKALIAAIIAFFAFGLVALCGCSKHIEGNCSSVVEQCQQLKADEKPTITVTGRVYFGNPGLYWLSDSGGSEGSCVVVYFEDDETRVSGRVTVVGKLWRVSDTESIAIHKAKVQSEGL